MPSVNQPADNREVVDLDQPAKEGKKKGIEPTAGCSTCPSIDVADGETQCQTCIVDEEFAESEAQEYPNVKPGSALARHWNFIKPTFGIYEYRKAFDTHDLRFGDGSSQRLNPAQFRDAILLKDDGAELVGRLFD